MDKIVVQHNSSAVADAIAKAGGRAIAAVDQALGRGALEVERDAVRRMPKFRSRTATATNVAHMGVLLWEIVFGGGHAVYTERGTGAGGRPTLDETLDWIRLKGITPDTPGMSRESLAFLIRRKIAREGVRAQPFAEPALLDNRARLEDLVFGAARAAMGTA
jgi:hypothetical protein